MNEINKENVIKEKEIDIEHADKNIDYLWNNIIHSGNIKNSEQSSIINNKSN